MTATRRDELANFLEEAAASVSDGFRPMSAEDARGIADEILHGDRSPEWISPAPLSPGRFMLLLAPHQRSEWHDDVVASGAWGTGGWVCQCGVVITDGIELTVPSQAAGLSAVSVWMATHQSSVLAAAGAS